MSLRKGTSETKHGHGTIMESKLPAGPLDREATWLVESVRRHKNPARGML
jgi:hypothetical protein